MYGLERGAACTEWSSNSTNTKHTTIAIAEDADEDDQHQEQDEEEWANLLVLYDPPVEPELWSSTFPWRRDAVAALRLRRLDMIVQCLLFGTYYY